MNNSVVERRVLNKQWLLQHISQFPEDYVTELHTHMWFTLYGQNIKIGDEENEQDGKN